MTNLNPEQRIAADHDEGAMLVIAGPGTGKTATLAARFKTLVARGAPPDGILCLTFTAKAGRQLRDRIALETGLAVAVIPAGTVHAFALHLFRNFPQAFPTLFGRHLVSEAAQSRAIKSAAQHLAMDEAEAPQAISGFKDLLISPAQALEHANAPGALVAERDTARLYAAYQAHLKKNHAFDFGDLIAGVLEGLRANPGIVARLGEKFPYVMVDEYQDINVAQHQLVELLTRVRLNLWVVGDDDQALYGWRHSSSDFILSFEKSHPDARCQILTRNYRSSATILEAANALIRRNRMRFAKSLIPTHPKGPPIRVHIARTAETEAEWVARRAVELIANGMPASSIAVLSRVAHNLGPIERALARHGIATRIGGAQPFWTSVPIRQALSLIQTLAGKDLDPNLDTPARWILEKLRSKHRQKDLLPTARLVIHELFEYPPKRYNEERRAAWRYALAQLLTEFEAHPELQSMRTLIATGRKPGDGSNGIEAATIHSAKGLEWPAVFIIGLEQGLMPHARSEDQEEERRLAFVAITRAAERLFLSRAEERNRRDSAPSPYLRELLSGVSSDDVLTTSDY